jgi:hypothetical protein
MTHPAQYPATFEVKACEAADEAVKPLNLQAAKAKLNDDWDAYTKAVRASKVLWLDTYLANAEKK